MAASGASSWRSCACHVAGTRLVRDWGGVSHHVLVLESGYHYGDRRYSSLSQIARDITGAHWSGPRFFGLKRERAAADA